MQGPPESEGLEPAPDVVSDLADACVRFVSQALEIELDRTQDTLPVLDHYLSRGEEIEEEVVALVGPASGAYFGEVIRRHVGEGRWHVSGEDYAGWRLELPTAGIIFNPIGVALEVVTGEDAEGWHAHYKVSPEDRERARAAVERLGEVQEDDFYTFAVRFDVLVQVYESLRPPPGAGEPA